MGPAGAASCACGKIFVNTSNLARHKRFSKKCGLKPEVPTVTRVNVGSGEKVTIFKVNEEVKEVKKVTGVKVINVEVEKVGVVEVEMEGEVVKEVQNVGVIEMEMGGEEGSGDKCQYCCQTFSSRKSAIQHKCPLAPSTCPDTLRLTLLTPAHAAEFIEDHQFNSLGQVEECALLCPALPYSALSYSADNPLITC